MKPRIHVLTLGTKDLKKSVEFFEKGLGWKKSSASQEEVAFFQIGRLVLGLFPREELAKDAGVSAEGEGFAGVSIGHNVGSEAEVDAVMQEVERLGAKIVKPAQKTFWGGYSGYFYDLDGHLWEVVHAPMFAFDANDNLALP